MPRSAASTADSPGDSGGAALAASYGSLFQRLLPAVTGSLFVDRDLQFIGSVGTMAAHRAVIEWMSTLGWRRARISAAAMARDISGGACLVAIPFADSQSTFIGAVCVQLAAGNDARAGRKPEAAVRDAIGPALECLHREFSRMRDPVDADVTVERT